jgi:hypothetical protein
MNVSLLDLIISSVLLALFYLLCKWVQILKVPQILHSITLHNADQALILY